MEQWNNLELKTSKKSYTLNQQYNDKRQDHGDTVANKGRREQNTDDTKPPKHQTHPPLAPGSDIKPKICIEDVETWVRRLYGITIGNIEEMNSYDDRNYRIHEDPNIKNPLITTHCPHGYNFKILNALDSQKTEFVEAQNEMMVYLSKHNIRCPRPVQNANGKYYSTESIDGKSYVVRLLEYIPGKILHEVPKSNYLLYQCGKYLANIDKCLKNFSHRAYDTRESIWTLQSIPRLRDFLYAVEIESRRTLVLGIIEAFEAKVLSRVSSLEAQVIHGDYNEQNIIVTKEEHQKDYSVMAIIDFGDSNKAPLIFEIGIAMAYMMIESKSLESGGIFLAGYNATRPVSPSERGYLKYCVAARLAQSLVLGAYTYSLNPGNKYVLSTHENGWQLIEELWNDKWKDIDEIWEASANKYLTQSCK